MNSKKTPFLMAVVVAIIGLIWAQFHAPMHLRPLTNRLLDYPNAIPTATVTHTGAVNIKISSNKPVLSLFTPRLSGNIRNKIFSTPQIALIEREKDEPRASSPKTTSSSSSSSSGGNSGGGGSSGGGGGSRPERVKDDDEPIVVVPKPDKPSNKPPKAKDGGSNTPTPATPTTPSPSPTTSSVADQILADAYRDLYGDEKARYGYNYDTGAAATSADWNDPNAKIAGTYVVPETGERRSIAVGPTLKAEDDLTNYVADKITKLSNNEIEAIDPNANVGETVVKLTDLTLNNVKKDVVVQIQENQKDSEKIRSFLDPSTGSSNTDYAYCGGEKSCLDGYLISLGVSNPNDRAQIIQDKIDNRNKWLKDLDVINNFSNPRSNSDELAKELCNGNENCLKDFKSSSREEILKENLFYTDLANYAISSYRANVADMIPMLISEDKTEFNKLPLSTRKDIEQVNQDQFNALRVYMYENRTSRGTDDKSTEDYARELNKLLVQNPSLLAELKAKYDKNPSTYSDIFEYHTFKANLEPNPLVVVQYNDWAKNAPIDGLFENGKLLSYNDVSSEFKDEVRRRACNGSGNEEVISLCSELIVYGVDADPKSLSPEQKQKLNELKSQLDGKLISTAPAIMQEMLKEKKPTDIKLTLNYSNIASIDNPTVSQEIKDRAISKAMNDVNPINPTQQQWITIGEKPKITPTQQIQINSLADQYVKEQLVTETYNVGGGFVAGTAGFVAGTVGCAFLGFGALACGAVGAVAGVLASQVPVRQLTATEYQQEEAKLGDKLGIEEAPLATAFIHSLYSNQGAAGDEGFGRSITTRDNRFALLDSYGQLTSNYTLSQIDANIGYNYSPTSTNTVNIQDMLGTQALALNQWEVNQNRQEAWTYASLPIAAVTGALNVGLGQSLATSFTNRAVTSYAVSKIAADTGTFLASSAINSAQAYAQFENTTGDTSLLTTQTQQAYQSCLNSQGAEKCAFVLADLTSETDASRKYALQQAFVNDSLTQVAQTGFGFVSATTEHNAILAKAKTLDINTQGRTIGSIQIDTEVKIKQIADSLKIDPKDIAVLNNTDLKSLSRAAEIVATPEIKTPTFLESAIGNMRDLIGVSREIERGEKAVVKITSQMQADLETVKSAGIPLKPEAQPDGTVRISKPADAVQNVSDAIDHLNSLAKLVEESNGGRKLTLEQANILYTPAEVTNAVKAMGPGGGKSSFITKFELARSNRTAYLAANPTEALETLTTNFLATDAQRKFAQDNLGEIYYIAEDGGIHLVDTTQDNFTPSNATLVDPITFRARMSDSNSNITLFSSRAGLGWETLRTGGWGADLTQGTYGKFHFVVDEGAKDLLGSLSVSQGENVVISSTQKGRNEINVFNEVYGDNDGIRPTNSITKVGDHYLPSSHADHNAELLRIANQTISKIEQENNSLLSRLFSDSDPKLGELRQIKDMLASASDESSYLAARDRFNSLLHGDGDSATVRDLSMRASFLANIWDQMGMNTNDFGLNADGSAILLRQAGGDTGQTYSQTGKQLALYKLGAEQLKNLGIDTKNLPAQDKLTINSHGNSMVISEWYQQLLSHDHSFAMLDGTPDSLTHILGLGMQGEPVDFPSKFAKLVNSYAADSDFVGSVLKNIESEKNKLHLVVLGDHRVDFDNASEKLISGSGKKEVYIAQYAKNGDEFFHITPDGKKISISKQQWDEGIHRIAGSKNPQDGLVIIQGRDRALDLTVTTDVVNMRYHNDIPRESIGTSSIKDSATQGVYRNRLLVGRTREDIITKLVATGEYTPETAKAAVDDASSFHLYAHESLGLSNDGNNIIATLETQHAEHLGNLRLQAAMTNIGNTYKNAVRTLELLGSDLGLSRDSDFIKFVAEAREEGQRVSDVYSHEHAFKPMQSQEAIANELFARGMREQERLKSFFDKAVKQLSLNSEQQAKLRTQLGLTDAEFTRSSFDAILAEKTDGITPRSFKEFPSPARELAYWAKNNSTSADTEITYQSPSKAFIQPTTELATTKVAPKSTNAIRAPLSTQMPPTLTRLLSAQDHLNTIANLASDLDIVLPEKEVNDAIEKLEQAKKEHQQYLSNIKNEPVVLNLTSNRWQNLGLNIASWLTGSINNPRTIAEVLDKAGYISHTTNEGKIIEFIKVDGVYYQSSANNELEPISLDEALALINARPDREPPVPTDLRNVGLTIVDRSLELGAGIADLLALPPLSQYTTSQSPIIKSPQISQNITNLLKNKPESNSATESKPKEIVPHTPIKFRGGVEMHITGNVYSIENPLKIGRQELKNTLIIPTNQISTKVSREHADVYFDKDSNGWVIVDHDSTNGTYITDKKIAGVTKLTSGDIIELGKDSGYKINVVELLNDNKSIKLRFITPTPNTDRWLSYLETNIPESSLIDDLKILLASGVDIEPITFQGFFEEEILKNAIDSIYRKISSSKEQLPINTSVESPKVPESPNPVIPSQIQQLALIADYSQILDEEIDPPSGDNPDTGNPYTSQESTEYITDHGRSSLLDQINSTYQTQINETTQGLIALVNTELQNNNKLLDSNELIKFVSSKIQLPKEIDQLLEFDLVAKDAFKSQILNSVLDEARKIISKKINDSRKSINEEEQRKLSEIESRILSAPKPVLYSNQYYAIPQIQAIARTILGIDTATVSDADATAAFRALARLFHPDTNNSAIAETIFKAINEAHEIAKSSHSFRRIVEKNGIKYIESSEAASIKLLLGEVTASRKSNVEPNKQANAPKPTQVRDYWSTNVTFGRHSRNKVVVGANDNSVSRDHFEIGYDVDGYYIINLSQNAETKVNRKSMKPGSNRTLHHLDTIQAGDQTFFVRITDSHIELFNKQTGVLYRLSSKDGSVTTQDPPAKEEKIYETDHSHVAPNPGDEYPGVGIALDFGNKYLDRERGNGESMEDIALFHVNPNPDTADRLGKGISILADGAGKSGLGYLVSRLIQQRAGDIFYSSTNPDINERLRDTLEQINREVAELKLKLERDGVDDVALAQMASTIELVVVVGNKAHIAHVGDSETWVIRDNKSFILTKDHSPVGSLLDNGDINVEEAGYHPEANKISAAIQGDDDILSSSKHQIVEVELKPGDVIVSMSDGMVDVYRRANALVHQRLNNPNPRSGRALAATVTKGGTAQEISQRLLNSIFAFAEKQLKSNGEPYKIDNISIQVIKYDELGNFEKQAERAQQAEAAESPNAESQKPGTQSNIPPSQPKTVSIAVNARLVDHSNSIQIFSKVDDSTIKLAYPVGNVSAQAKPTFRNFWNIFSPGMQKANIQTTIDVQIGGIIVLGDKRYQFNGFNTQGDATFVEPNNITKDPYTWRSLFDWLSGKTTNIINSPIGVGGNYPNQQSSVSSAERKEPSKTVTQDSVKTRRGYINKDSKIYAYITTVVADGVSGSSKSHLGSEAATQISANGESKEGIKDLQSILLETIIQASKQGVNTIQTLHKNIDDYLVKKLANLVISQNSRDKEFSHNTTLSGISLLEYEGQQYYGGFAVGDSPIFMLRNGELHVLTPKEALPPNYSSLEKPDKYQSYANTDELADANVQIDTRVDSPFQLGGLSSPYVFFGRAYPGDIIFSSSDGFIKDVNNLEFLKKMLSENQTSEQLINSYRIKQTDDWSFSIIKVGSDYTSSSECSICSFELPSSVRAGLAATTKAEIDLAILNNNTHTFGRTSLQDITNGFLFARKATITSEKADYQRAIQYLRSARTKLENEKDQIEPGSEVWEYTDAELRQIHTTLRQLVKNIPASGTVYASDIDGYLTMLDAAVKHLEAISQDLSTNLLYLPQNLLTSTANLLYARKTGDMLKFDESDTTYPENDAVEILDPTFVPEPTEATKISRDSVTSVRRGTLLKPGMFINSPLGIVRVEEELGHGGFGTTYLVRTTNNSKTQYVLKVANESTEAIEMAKEEFEYLNEIHDTLVRENSDSVVNFVDAIADFKSPSFSYGYIMAHAGNRTLKQMREKGERLSVYAYNHLYDLAKTLDSYNLPLTDIYITNILLNQRGLPTIIDPISKKTRMKLLREIPDAEFGHKNSYKVPLSYNNVQMLNAMFANFPELLPKQELEFKNQGPNAIRDRLLGRTQGFIAFSEFSNFIDSLINYGRSLFKPRESELLNQDIESDTQDFGAPTTTTQTPPTPPILIDIPENVVIRARSNSAQIDDLSIPLPSTDSQLINNYIILDRVIKLFEQYPTITEVAINDIYTYKRDDLESMQANKRNIQRSILTNPNLEINKSSILDNRYILASSNLSSGATGNIRLAWDTRLGRPVIIKILKKSDSSDQENSDLLEEARIGAAFSNISQKSNILYVFDTFTANNLQHNVYEYYPSDNLRTYYSQRRLLSDPVSTNQTLSILKSIALGLDTLHSKSTSVNPDIPILHRDVKPANILLNPNDSTKAILVDIGHSYVNGTLPYMSSRQLNGNLRPDMQSENRALLVTAFELLTGQRAFPNENLDKTESDIINNNWNKEALATTFPGNTALADFFAEVFAEENDIYERFPSAQALIGQLDLLINPDKYTLEFTEQNPETSFWDRFLGRTLGAVEFPEMIFTGPRQEAITFPKMVKLFDDIKIYFQTQKTINNVNKLLNENDNFNIKSIPSELLPITRKVIASGEIDTLYISHLVRALNDTPKELRVTYITKYLPMWLNLGLNPNESLILALNSTSPNLRQALLDKHIKNWTENGMTLYDVARVLSNLNKNPSSQSLLIPYISSWGEKAGIIVEQLNLDESSIELLSPIMHNYLSLDQFELVKIIKILQSHANKSSKLYQYIEKWEIFDSKTLENVLTQIERYPKVALTIAPYIKDIIDTNSNFYEIVEALNENPDTAAEITENLSRWNDAGLYQSTNLDIVRRFIIELNDRNINNDNRKMILSYIPKYIQAFIRLKNAYYLDSTIFIVNGLSEITSISSMTKILPMLETLINNGMVDSGSFRYGKIHEFANQISTMPDSLLDQIKEYLSLYPAIDLGLINSNLKLISKIIQQNNASIFPEIISYLAKWKQNHQAPYRFDELLSFTLKHATRSEGKSIKFAQYVALYLQDSLDNNNINKVDIELIDEESLSYLNPQSALFWKTYLNYPLLRKRWLKTDGIQFFFSLSESQLSLYATLAQNIDESPVAFIQKIKDSLILDLISTKDPLETYNNINEVLSRNNLPEYLKLVKVFDLLYPPSLLEAKISSRTSPVIQAEASDSIRRSILKSDIFKSTVESANRDLEYYLTLLKDHSNLVDRFIRGEKLNSQQVKHVTVFINKMDALYRSGNLDQTRPGLTLDPEQFKNQEYLRNFIRNSLYLDLNVSPNQSLISRIEELFLQNTGYSSLDEIVQHMRNLRIQTNTRNLIFANENPQLKLEFNDLLKGAMDKFQNTSMLGILSDGFRAREFMGTSADSDLTPLDTDLSTITSSDAQENFDTAFKKSIASKWGKIVCVTKNTQGRFYRSDLGQNSAEGMFELFVTGAIDSERHVGIRGAYPSTYFDAIIDNGLDEKELNGLYQSIIFNGFYIPVYSTGGSLIFTPQMYQERLKFFAGIHDQPLTIKPLSTQDLFTKIINQNGLNIDPENNSEDIKRVETPVKEKIKNILSSLGIILADDPSSASLTDALLINIGSSGRSTNLPGDYDFDYTLVLNRRDFEKSSEIADAIRKEFSHSSETSAPSGETFIQIRLNEVKIPQLSELLDLDIGINAREDMVVYSPGEAVSDRLSSLSPEDKQRTIANILLTKKLLKDGHAYKQYEDGGIGGIGVENWILSNHGNVREAFETFWQSAHDKDGNLLSLEEFKKIYPIHDPGINFRYQYFDNYINKLTESGYLNMLKVIDSWLHNENRAPLSLSPALAFGGTTTIAQGLIQGAYNLANTALPVILPELSNHSIIYNIQTWVDNLHLIPEYLRQLLPGYKSATPPPLQTQTVFGMSIIPIFTPNTRTPSTNLTSQFSSSKLPPLTPLYDLPPIPQAPPKNTTEHFNILRHITNSRSVNTILLKINELGINLYSQFTNQATALEVLYRHGKLAGIAGYFAQHKQHSFYARQIPPTPVESNFTIYGTNNILIDLANPTKVLSAEIQGLTKLANEVAENQLLVDQDFNLHSYKNAELPVLSRTVRIVFPATENNIQKWYFSDVPLKDLINLPSKDITQLSGILLGHLAPSMKILQKSSAVTEESWFNKDLSLQETPLAVLAFTTSNHSNDEPVYMFDHRIGTRLVTAFEPTSHKSKPATSYSLQKITTSSSHLVNGLPTAKALDEINTILTDKYGFTPESIRLRAPDTKIITTELGNSVASSVNQYYQNAARPTPANDSLMHSADSLAHATNLVQVNSTLSLDPAFHTTWSRARSNFKDLAIPYSLPFLFAASILQSGDFPSPVHFPISTDTPNDINVGVVGGLSYARLARSLRTDSPQILSDKELHKELATIVDLLNTQIGSRTPNSSTPSYFLSILNKNLVQFQYLARKLLRPLADGVSSNIQVSYLGAALDPSSPYATTFETATTDQTSYGVGIRGGNINFKNTNDPYLWTESILELYTHTQPGGNQFRASFGALLQNEEPDIKAYINDILRAKNPVAEYRRLVATAYLDTANQDMLDRVTAAINHALVRAFSDPQNSHYKLVIRELYALKTEELLLRYVQNIYALAQYLSDKSITPTTTSDLTLAIAELKNTQVTNRQKIDAVMQVNVPFYAPAPNLVLHAMLIPDIAIEYGKKVAQYLTQLGKKIFSTTNNHNISKSIDSTSFSDYFLDIGVNAFNVFVGLWATMQGFYISRRIYPNGGYDQMMQKLLNIPIIGQVVHIQYYFLKNHFSDFGGSILATAAVLAFLNILRMIMSNDFYSQIISKVNKSSLLISFILGVGSQILVEQLSPNPDPLDNAFNIAGGLTVILAMKIFDLIRSKGFSLFNLIRKRYGRF